MSALVNCPCPVCGQDRWMSTKNSYRARAMRCRDCYRHDPEWLTSMQEAQHRGIQVWTARQAEVDEMAVVRLLAGMPVNSTRAERQAAVAALTARRVGTAVIAERLRVTTRTVERLRARERVAA